MQTEVTIYTDGSSRGNPGPGGYGAVLLCPPYRKEISCGYRLTTNNRMELLAVIAALEALRRPCSVTVYSDSQYVVNAVQKGWLESWMRKNFAGKKNADLWRRYAEAAKTHRVKMVWIKGHADTPEHERCDRMAVAAAEGKCLETDAGYETEMQTALMPGSHNPEVE